MYICDNFCDEVKRRLGFNNREYMRFILDRELDQPHLVMPPPVWKATGENGTPDCQVAIMI
ncbi:MAG: hypothetical protein WCK89_12505 [bacterium]